MATTLRFTRSLDQFTACLIIWEWTRRNDVQNEFKKVFWEWRFKNFKTQRQWQWKKSKGLISKDRSQSKHTTACSQSHASTVPLKEKEKNNNNKKRIFPERVEYGRNSKYQTQKKGEVSLLHRNGRCALCDIKNCRNKNGAVIKINYFPFCKACEGRKLTQTAREMRKHPFYPVLRVLFHNLSHPSDALSPPRPCSLLFSCPLTKLLS